MSEAKNCFCGNLRQEAQKQQRNNKYENKNAQSIKQRGHEKTQANLIKVGSLVIAIL